MIRRHWAAAKIGWRMYRLWLAQFTFVMKPSGIFTYNSTTGDFEIAALPGRRGAIKFGWQMYRLSLGKFSTGVQIVAIDCKKARAAAASVGAEVDDAEGGLIRINIVSGTSAAALARVEKVMAMLGETW